MSETQIELLTEDRVYMSDNMSILLIGLRKLYSIHSYLTEALYSTSNFNDICNYSTSIGLVSQYIFKLESLLFNVPSLRQKYYTALHR